MTQRIKASCHCGAVELEAILREDLASARRCDCTFCRRRAAPNVSIAEGDLHVVKGEENLTLYSFGTHTAQHFFCKTCGIYTHHKRRSNPREFGLNLGAIDGVNPADYEPMVWVDGINDPPAT
ncbi:GFA family protein [Marivita hallyeonensis]|uniref:Uncharacterized conserved protein n=1 Tax=Marivita hallyeonensis TaxID=996342 RepID=A0A1M5MWA7_9RHOB|nr:GFA family protein [Marivita hallyeonensis]SHG81610.1 Uncharacterized conserved protein [Marivita hallyeonensis]